MQNLHQIPKKWFLTVLKMSVSPPTAQETLHHQHHTFTSSPCPSLPPFSASASGVPGGRDDDEFPRRDERCLQWSNQETRDFIKIRGQLEGQFTSTKRNKNLWEMVVSRMREKGYRRTPDQCKCKWKNLVNRYKVHRLIYTLFFSFD